MLKRKLPIYDEIDLSIINKKQCVENYNTLFDDVQIYNQYLNNSNNPIFDYYKLSIKEIILNIMSLAKNCRNINQEFKDLELLQYFIFGSYKLRIPINIIYNKLYFYWKKYHFINNSILKIIEKKIIQYYHEDNDFTYFRTNIPEFDNILLNIYNYIINYQSKYDNEICNSCNLCNNNTHINNLCICNICCHKNPKKLVDYYFLYIILVMYLINIGLLKKLKNLYVHILMMNLGIKLNVC